MADHNWLLAMGKPYRVQSSFPTGMNIRFTRQSCHSALSALQIIAFELPASFPSAVATLACCGHLLFAQQGCSIAEQPVRECVNLFDLTASSSFEAVETGMRAA